MQQGYGPKTYLPRLARTMYETGKYIFEHKAKAYAALDQAKSLTPEQKAQAKALLDDILAKHELFKALHRELNTTTP